MTDAFAYLLGSGWEHVVSTFLDQIFTYPKKLIIEYRNKRYGEDRVLSTNMNPTLNYWEFAMSIWMLTHFELSTLAFNLYDTDCSGQLDKDEVEAIVSSVYGTSSARAGLEVNVTHRPVDDRAKQILEGMDVDGDGNVSKGEWAKRASLEKDEQRHN